ncbi:MAG: acetoacetate--CoA ligase [Chloroflexota bacterium]
MGTPLWEPSPERQRNANINRFIQSVNRRYRQKIASYDELHRWSFASPDEFWSAVWDFCEIKAEKRFDTVIERGAHMIETKWFTGARLNFAENLLRYRDNHTALIFRGEDKVRSSMTYARLYDEVGLLTKSLKDLGVRPADRICGFMPNMIETVVAMLAGAAIGATWSSCSPDFGVKGALDRFGQIQPKVLFTADGYFYNGKTFDSLEKVAEIIKGLSSVEKVIVVPYTRAKPDISNLPKSTGYREFLSQGKPGKIEFEELPPDHPLYIMYSSGTTGLPKCMVQGAAGVLLGQLKEQKLHVDLKRDDTIFYATTCGWMMWNWLVSSLALGATVVLYDGSPFYSKPDSLFEMAQDEMVTVFGTSARYLAGLEKSGAKPGKKYNLTPLKTILSTGSPLSPASFDYVYRDIKQDVLLSSISGGTDINGCFFLGSPTLPVYQGELQCKGLGMDVRAFDAGGNSVSGEKGELVCLNPYPSMPLYFWDDKDSQKYLSAYFGVYPNVWRHGDFVEITESGGAVIYGRSDATLKPGGVRIGTADIYRVVETITWVKDSIVVGQEWEGDVRIILFVRLPEELKLTEILAGRIKSKLRLELSPRHVPAKVIAVPEIPYTLNGKKVELAVRNVIHNQPVTNVDALANPGSLNFYKDLEALRS